MGKPSFWNLRRFDGVWTLDVGYGFFEMKGRKLIKGAVMNPRALRIGRWEIVMGRGV